MIHLRINGRPVDVEGQIGLSEYLAARGIRPELVAVEVNSTILARSEFAQAVLRDGDVVEIVRMVGGGGEPGYPSTAGTPAVTEWKEGISPAWPSAVGDAVKGWPGSA